MVGNTKRRAPHHISGCYYTTGERHHRLIRHYFPQVHLISHTTICPLHFTTSLTQTFSNPTSNTIKEARYTFPLYDGVSVTAFTCTIDGRVIVGHVQQKDQARKTFEDAVEKGQSAGLLESLPLGVFSTSLGNVPANQDVVVNITYGGELKHDAEIDGLRYNIPTSICPRYGEYPGELLNAGSTVSSRGMRITVDVDMQSSPIRKIQSQTKHHPISVSLGNLSTETGQATPKSTKASVTMDLESTEFTSDFVLQILVDDISSPKAVLEKHPTLPGHQALITTFVPKFSLRTTKPEVVFIADQSGSMRGEKNTALVSALSTFLKSIPFGVRFNICPFGSRHEFLWEKSQLYTSDNASQALAFVRNFSASMGGTQMFAPVQDAFKRRLGDLPLEIILLTDGAITQESQLFDFINAQIVVDKVNARVFSLGIGGNVSSTLVEGVARAGRGFSQFVTEGEALDHKVVRMLKAALYPHIDEFTLEPQYAEEEDDFEMVDNASIEADKQVEVVKSKQDTEKTPDLSQQAAISMFDAEADVDAPIGTGEDRYAHLPDLAIPPVLQIPGQHSPLFLFNRTTVYLIMENASHKTVTSVVLRASTSRGPLELSIPVQASESGGSTIHHLAICKLTQELEEGRGWVMDRSINNGTPVRDSSYAGEIAEKEAVRLGLKYQVANKWCSFVAVEDSKPVRDDDKETPAEVNHPIRASSMMMSNLSLNDTRQQPLTSLSSTAGTPKRKTGFACRVGSPRGGSSSAKPQSGGLFGASSTSSTGGFGLASAVTSATGGSFGPSSATSDPSGRTSVAMDAAPASGGLFGSGFTPPPAPSGPSGRAPLASAMFRGDFFEGLHAVDALNTTPVSSNAPSASGGLFGRAENAVPSSGGLFGSGGLFSSIQSATPSSGGLFGGATRVAPAPVGMLYGSDSSALLSIGNVALFGSGNNTADPITPEPIPTDPMDKVRYLITAQTFSGYWEFTDVVLPVIGLTASTVVEKGGKEDRATMTALVIRYLQKECKQFEGVWDMVVPKAEFWLDSELVDDDRAKLHEIVELLL